MNEVSEIRSELRSEPMIEAAFPLKETADVTAILDGIKERVTYLSSRNERVYC